MFKLALTAGHYLGTSGKQCLKSIDPNRTKEWVLNDRIADKIQTLLSQYEDITILRTDDTTGKQDISLSKRVSAANNFDADFYLSIHHNAGINGGKGGGIVVYTCPNASSESRKWQNELYDNLIKKTQLKGNRSQPIAQSNLYEVKYTRMPAVLLELGFMDSTTDTPIILTEAYANKCAEACVEVIVARAGLKKKVTSTTNTLKKGMSGDSVRRLQNLLNLFGYNCGTADGVFGQKTVTAVMLFQKAYKLKQDAIFGKDSYNAMKRCITSYKSSFKIGSTGTAVVALQNIIKDYGYDCGKSDGTYGNKTAEAVKAYQKSRGLARDGKVGPKTIGTFVDYLKL